MFDDAKRCLQCKKPQCSRGCPVGTPVREAIHKLLNAEIAQAGQLLFENNPLSLVCSYVCPQENQCEGHCVLGKKGSPVQISAVEQYISDYYLNVFKPKASKRTNGKVAIIGSGPAGITIAFLLSARDYDVTVFEGHDKIGGVLRYGIPEFRLPKRVLDRLTQTLTDSGVRIRPNITVGKNLSVDDMFRDGYKAVFMGTGVWNPYKLGIKGESFGNVNYAIDYLRNPDVYNLGKTLAVIGAGNAAMDVARTALRHGCEEVTVFCRSNEVTAREVETAYAKIDGVEIVQNKSAAEFTDSGVILADTETQPDENRNLETHVIEGTEQLFPCDSVIIAIGQGPRAVIVSATEGIDVTERGLVAVDDCGRTSREGVFASGDVVTGAKTVAEAVRVSKRVAQAIDEYCSQSTMKLELLQKENFEKYANAMFSVLAENMSEIAPTGNSFEDDYRQWGEAVRDGLKKENRQILLIFGGKEIIGFFQYCVNKEIFMMEEIQIAPQWQGKNALRLLYSHLLSILPPGIKTVEAYSNKKNLKSQGILGRLGLQIIGENESGSSYFYRGDFESLLNWHHKTN